MLSENNKLIFAEEEDLQAQKEQSLQLQRYVRQKSGEIQKCKSSLEAVEK